VDITRNWSERVEQPGGEHFVLVYQDLDFLAETVTCYIGRGLRHGEAALSPALHHARPTKAARR
jgi:hypothetical protein